MTDTEKQDIKTTVSKELIASATPIEKVPLRAIPATWAELKALRDAGGLLEGRTYRLTDYGFTTSQDGTKSAGHRFDLLITADSASRLNEECRAMPHEGDDYFAACDLSAWRVWYTIDNDTSRFAWAVADPTDGTAPTGRGVIYRLTDEHLNDCGYDFKNALFLRASGTDIDSTTLAEDTYFYTFNQGTTGFTYATDGTAATSGKDGSMDKGSNVYYPHDNTVPAYTFASTGGTVGSDPAQLPANVFSIPDYGTSRYWGSGGMHSRDLCSDNRLSAHCSGNTFGSVAVANDLGGTVSDNSFPALALNTMQGTVIGNTFKQPAYNNTFGGSVQYNTFGGYVQYNTFGGYVQQNTFGGYVQGNSAGMMRNCVLTGQVTHNTFITTAADGTEAPTNIAYCQFPEYVNGMTFTSTAASATSGERIQMYTFRGKISNADYKTKKVSAPLQASVWTDNKTAPNRIFEQKSDGTFVDYVAADLAPSTAVVTPTEETITTTAATTAAVKNVKLKVNNSIDLSDGGTYLDGGADPDDGLE